MFNLEQSIEEWRRQMLAAGIKSPVPLEELECHLREEMEKQIRLGQNEQLAFENALERIGRARILENEFKKADALKEMVQGAAKNLLGIVVLALPVIVLISTICLVSEWQGPRLVSFSVYPNAHLISTLVRENAPVSLAMNHPNPGAGSLLEMYNRFAGGRWGTPWWFPSVCAMEVLLFSLALTFATYFETPKNREDSRRQRRIFWIGQFLLGISGLFVVLLPPSFFALSVAATICTAFIFGLRRQSRAAVMGS